MLLVSLIVLSKQGGARCACAVLVLLPKLPTLRASEVGSPCLVYACALTGLARKTRRLRSGCYSDSPPGGAWASHGGALVWAVLAVSADLGAGHTGHPGQRVPAGVGGAGHARYPLQAAATVVGDKSPGHPAGVGVLREHGNRAVSPPRSGRPERIHT